MTTQSEIEQRVRARSKNTGESCPTARRAVTAAAVAPAATVARPAYILHPDTSAIANVLANTGVLVGDAVDTLFADLGARLLELYEAEHAAYQRLVAAVDAE